MPEISIRIKNIREIKRAFGLAPSLMARELNTAVRKVVLNIGGDSRRLTPVDTGRLRASTYERFAPLRGEIGTNTEYDIFVHEGTRFMKGRPYLRTAVDKNTQFTNRMFVEAVEKVLNTIGRNT